MTELELLAVIPSNGWEVLVVNTLKTEGTVIWKEAVCCKIEGDVLRKQALKYYLKGDACYWQNIDPFASPEPHVPNFGEKAQIAINALVDSGQIKAGYIERINADSETGIVVVIASDNSIKMFHIYKDTEGAIQRTEIMGTYPIGR